MSASAGSPRPCAAQDPHLTMKCRRSCGARCQRLPPSALCPTCNWGSTAIRSNRVGPAPWLQFGITRRNRNILFRHVVPADEAQPCAKWLRMTMMIVLMMLKMVMMVMLYFSSFRGVGWRILAFSRVFCHFFVKKSKKNVKTGSYSTFFGDFWRPGS